ETLRQGRLFPFGNGFLFFSTRDPHGQKAGSEFVGLQAVILVSPEDDEHETAHPRQEQQTGHWNPPNSRLSRPAAMHKMERAHWLNYRRHRLSPGHGFCKACAKMSFWGPRA